MTDTDHLRRFHDAKRIIERVAETGDVQLASRWLELQALGGTEPEQLVGECSGRGIVSIHFGGSGVIVSRVTFTSTDRVVRVEQDMRLIIAGPDLLSAVVEHWSPRVLQTMEQLSFWCPDSDEPLALKFYGVYLRP